MPAIVTLTMNPALDVSTATERVLPAHKLRCDAPVLHPGGGGINVARVLQRLGADCMACYPAGGINGGQLQQMLERESVPTRVIAIAGSTRESLAVHETASGQEFRFVFPGPQLQESEWQACLELIDQLTPPARYLVASGSLPPGVPEDFYARLAQAAKRRGSLFVLDSSGPALAAALAAGVYLVKPSLRELSELVGAALNTPAQRLQAARRLVEQAQAQIVALSLGEEGALLVTAEGAWQARGLPVKVESAIGAGDSFLAGLLWSLNRQADLEQAFRHAMAAGSAALLSAGTALCQPADVQRLYADVTVSPV